MSRYENYEKYQIVNEGIQDKNDANCNHGVPRVTYRTTALKHTTKRVRMGHASKGDVLLLLH